MALDHWMIEAEEELEPLLADYRGALARSDISIIEPELRDYLRKRGLPIVLNSERYYQAGLAVLRAHVRTYEGMLARHRGQEAEPRTLQGAGHAVRRFTKWHGDIRLGAITKERARELRDAVAKLPPRLPREELKKSLRSRHKVKHEAGSPGYASTVNKLLQMLARGRAQLSLGDESESSPFPEPL